MSNPLGGTPHHYLKPKLEWIGKLLGCDVYIDLRSSRQPAKLRNTAERVLEALSNNSVTKESDQSVAKSKSKKGE